MNCLNRLEMQHYLDDEISSENRKVFTNHIQTCDSCKRLIDQTETEITQVNQIISFAQLDEDQIFIPPFHESSKNIIRKKWIIYSSIAAGILLVIGLFQYNMKNESDKRIENIKMEMERCIYESDPNKIWNEKQSIITVFDRDGNLIYLNN